MGSFCEQTDCPHGYNQKQGRFGSKVFRVSIYQCSVPKQDMAWSLIGGLKREADYLIAYPYNGKLSVNSLPDNQARSPSSVSYIETTDFSDWHLAKSLVLCSGCRDSLHSTVAKANREHLEHLVGIKNDIKFVKETIRWLKRLKKSQQLSQ